MDNISEIPKDMATLYTATESPRSRLETPKPFHKDIDHILKVMTNLTDAKFPANANSLGTLFFGRYLWSFAGYIIEIILIFREDIPPYYKSYFRKICHKL